MIILNKAVLLISRWALWWRVWQDQRIEKSTCHPRRRFLPGWKVCVIQKSVRIVCIDFSAIFKWMGRPRTAERLWSKSPRRRSPRKNTPKYVLHLPVEFIGPFFTAQQMRKEIIPWWWSEVYEACCGVCASKTKPMAERLWLFCITQTVLSLQQGNPCISAIKCSLKR